MRGGDEARGGEGDDAQRGALDRGTLAHTHQLAHTQLARSLRAEYQRAARDELGKGHVWKVKVFCLFPCLVHLVRLDHICRVLFPLAYLCFVLQALVQVDFGREQNRLLATSPCFR